MGRRRFEDLTGVRLGHKIIERLDLLGKVTGRSRSELIREGVSCVLQKYGLLGLSGLKDWECEEE